MHVKAWIPGQPSFDLGVLVGAGVICDQVHAQPRRDFLVDVAQKREPLEVRRAWGDTADDFCRPGRRARHKA